MRIKLGGQNATVWFIVGFLVVGTVAAIIAGVMSSGQPTEGDGSNIPAQPIAEGEWAIGGSSAPVSLIEYGDFQCPACAGYFPLVKKLLEEYDGRVHFAFRNFPLYSIHPNAGISAQAAEAAGLQGKYWEMSEALYVNQAEWSSAATNRVVGDYFDKYAQALGLDMDRFHRDMNSDQVLKKIRADVDSGNALKIGQTPTFYVNLKRIPNVRSYEDFKAIIDNALASS